MSDALAYDRSVRHYDYDGRLHVDLTPISKGNICPYYGREIPKAEQLGLQPDRVYQLFRDPEELKKAAATSNNIQLMQVHDPVTPGEPKQMKVVGSTGTDGVFQAPFLMNSLAVWVKEAIDLIESEKKKELSCAYHYDADMTPGEYMGARFDGTMRNIRFNHVALVDAGRAGADVMVADAMPLELQGEHHMPNTATVSRKALLAHGALSSFLRPRLAIDAAIDMKAVLLGTTAANWSQAKPLIVRRVEDATRGRLAKDATLDGLVLALDALDKEDEAEDDEIDGMDAKAAKDLKARDAKRAKDEGISEEEARERREAEDAKTARDARRAMDESEETEEEREERMKKRAADKKAADKTAKDARTARDRRPAKDRKTLDAKLGRKASDKEFEDWAKEEEEEPEHADDRRARDAEPRPVTKAAMDAAIERGVVEARETWKRDQAELREAERIVRPLVGELLAQDSATAVYHVALKATGVSVPADASIPVLKTMTQLAIRSQKPAPLALDGSTIKNFEQSHPEVARIRII